MGIKQPDFHKLWYDCFDPDLNTPPRKVTYRVRRDTNWGHDLIFLNSLVHDALFQLPDARLRGKRLRIPIRRDCWELGYTKHGELHCADSILTISPVASLSWTFVHALANLLPKKALPINGIVRDYPAHRGPCELRILGHGWSCLVAICADDTPELELKDLVVPYSYIERHGPKPKKRKLSN